MRSLKKMVTVFGAMGLTVLATASTSHAALITITNPSFELPAVADTVIGANPTGWTGGGQVINPGTAQTAGGLVPDGIQAVQFQPGTDFQSSLTQTLADNVAASTTYTLSVYVGTRSTLPFAGYTISLLGVNPTTSATTTLATITNSTTTAAAGEFALVTLSYQSPSDVDTSLKLGIKLAEVTTVTTGNPRTLMDNVTLDATATSIPEPATFGSVLTIAGPMLLARRRQ